MVNPGAFQGSRKAFLEAAIPGYFSAVQDGSGPEFLQTTVRRFLKRYPVDLADDVEPSEEQLDAVDDNEASDEVVPPTKDADETEESFAGRVAAFQQRKKDIKAKIDQIFRWFKYRYNKQHEGVMKGDPHPLDILLANLAGVSVTKPGRMRTAHNVWGKENQELIDELMAERQESKAERESGEESSDNEEAEGEGKGRKKKGKGKKKGKKFVKNGEEAYLAVRQEITKTEFAKLPDEVQQEWKARAEEEHKTRLEKWKAGQKAEFSTLPADRQRCIDRLVKFMQPILDGVSKATGWPCTFIAGGPEPADAGRLNILSIHSGTTSGDVPMTFGTACRPAFKKYWIPVFTAFLQMCFSMEESKSRGLVDTEMISLRAQLEGQQEETTATVDGVEISSREDFMREINELIAPEPKVVGKGKGKGTSKEAVRQSKTSGSERSQKIAELRHRGSQSQKSGSTSTLPPDPPTNASTAQNDPPNGAPAGAKEARPQPKPAATSRMANSPVSTSPTSDTLSGPPPPSVTTNSSGLKLVRAESPQEPSQSRALRAPQSPRLNAPQSPPPLDAPQSPPPLDTPQSSPPNVPQSPLPPLSPAHRMPTGPSFRLLSPRPSSPPPSPLNTIRASSTADCLYPQVPPTTSPRSPKPLSTSNADTTSGITQKKPSTRSSTARISSSATASLPSKRKANGRGQSRTEKRKGESDQEEVHIEEESEEDEPESEDCVDELAGDDELEEEDIPVPEDAPPYIWKTVQMCEQLNVGKEVNRLVGAWVALEAKAGFAGTSILTSASRPAQIGEWIQHGRRPNFKPKLPDLEGYGDKFCGWFKKCSPSWRTKTQGTIVMSREPGMNWSELKVTRQNGLASVVAAITFWKYGLDALPRSTPRQKQAFERLEEQFLEAIGEVSYCIAEMSRD